MTVAVRYRRGEKFLNYWCITTHPTYGYDIAAGVVGFPPDYHEYDGHCTPEKRERLIAEAERSGYKEPKEEELFVVGLEYNLRNWGNNEDFKKLTELRDLLDRQLNSRGLVVRGGISIGSGIMECHFFTVDPDITQAIIREMVVGTEFADYYRIFSGPAATTEYGLMHNPNNPI